MKKKDQPQPLFTIEKNIPTPTFFKGSPMFHALVETIEKLDVKESFVYNKMLNGSVSYIVSKLHAEANGKAFTTRMVTSTQRRIWRLK